MKKTCLLLSLLSFLIFSSGCGALLIGGAGVGAGYAFTGGTISGNFESDFDTVWFKTDEVLSEIGEITFADDKQGKMMGLTSMGETITVTLERITENTTKIMVNAKKGVLVKRKTAQKVFSTIVRRI